MPSRHRIDALRDELLCDDLKIPYEEMATWSEDQVLHWMETGGTEQRMPTVAILLASYSYPYTGGFGPSDLIDWHDEAALTSIVKHVIRPLEAAGLRVQVFVAVEAGLDTLMASMEEQGVLVARQTSLAARGFLPRVVAACEAFGIASAKVDHLVVARPDLLFRCDIPLPPSWPSQQIACRARTYFGPSEPHDPDLFSWWHDSHFQVAATVDILPDDQFLIVPHACLATFTRRISEAEFAALEGLGPEQSVEALMRKHRNLPFTCMAIPCVLQKHAALKAAAGKEQRLRIIHRSNPI